MDPEKHSDSKPPIPPDESDRLDELRRLRFMDAASNRRFDHYVSLVAELFQFPMVLISFVDKDKEWLKSSVGTGVEEVKRDISFCAHAISYEDAMVVPDAQRDPRFADNPLVTGPPHVRFYAGAVIRSPLKQPLGALCVIDYKPREFDAVALRQLRQFGDLVESEVRSCYHRDRLRDSLEYAAYFDPLTWLPNRRLLMSRLHKMLQTAADGGDELIVLGFLVPYLRLISKTFGSEAANNLLSQVGDRLIACCPPSGTVSHLQADEFFLAFPGSTDDFLAFTARLHNLLAEPFRLGGEDHYLNIRMGASNFPADGSAAAELVEQASVTLGMPETAWKGLRYYSDAESQTAEQELRLQSILRRALDEEQYHFVYQPIVSIQQHNPVYAEALIRWDDPELKAFKPMQLMDIAERSGLILDVGRQTRHAVLQQRRIWRDEFGLEIPLALNVSALELNNVNFARDLLHAFHAHEINPATMSVEVTEYSLVTDSIAVADNIKALRLANMKINVDDFGTGYSALAYLNRLAVSGIKIDRSFIQDLPFSHRQAALTLTIISMADALDLKTVAEGVETREQFEFLARTNCSYAQGFFLSHPVDADVLPRMWGHRLV